MQLSGDMIFSGENRARANSFKEGSADMKLFRSASLGFLTFWVLAENCAASPQLDQQYYPSNFTTLAFLSLSDNHFDAQTFTVGIQGNLVSIDLYLERQNPVSNVLALVDILPTSPGGRPDESVVLATGALPFTKISQSGGFVSIELNQPVPVSINEVLAIKVYSTHVYGTPDE